MKNYEEINFENKKNIKCLIDAESDKYIAKVKIADDFKSRLLGLMFKKDIDYPLLFIIPNRLKYRERSSIHSFFMRFELVLVFIDEENTVFEIVELKPWSYHSPKKSSKYIIEFKKDNFKEYNIKIGDKIKLK